MTTNNNEPRIQTFKLNGYTTCAIENTGLTQQNLNNCVYIQIGDVFNWNGGNAYTLVAVEFDARSEARIVVSSLFHNNHKIVLRILQLGEIKKEVLSIPNVPVYDEEKACWRVIWGGVLKIDKFCSRNEAEEGINRWSRNSSNSRFRT